MKNQLVQNLEDDHKKIMHLLTSIKVPYATLKSKHADFNALKELIIQHITIENTSVYPVLLKQEKTVMIAKTFSTGMETIAGEVMDFFTLFGNDIALPVQKQSGFEYAKALGRITGLVKNRISNEEKVLYPELH